MFLVLGLFCIYMYSPNITCIHISRFIYVYIFRLSILLEHEVFQGKISIGYTENTTRLSSLFSFFILVPSDRAV